MRGAFAGGDLILGQRGAAGEKPFLQGGLRVLGRQGVQGQRVGPFGAHQAADGFEAGIEVEGAEDGFEGVGADVFERGHAGAGGVGGERDGVGEADRFGDGGEDGARDQAGVAGAELALLLVGETFEQPLGHDEAEDAVADELEPFVGPGAAAQTAAAGFARGGGGAVGQGFAQEGRVAEAVAEPFLQLGRIGSGYRTSVKRRLQRTSNGHSHTSQIG